MVLESVAGLRRALIEVGLTTVGLLVVVVAVAVVVVEEEEDDVEVTGTSG